MLPDTDTALDRVPVTVPTPVCVGVRVCVGVADPVALRVPLPRAD